MTRQPGMPAGSGKSKGSPGAPTGFTEDPLTHSLPRIPFIPPPTTAFRGSKKLGTGLKP